MPEEGRRKPDIMWRRVLLPAPLGPRRPVDARADAEGDVVHGDEVAVPAGDVDDFDRGVAVHAVDSLVAPDDDDEGDQSDGEGGQRVEDAWKIGVRDLGVVLSGIGAEEPVSGPPHEVVGTEQECPATGVGAGSDSKMAVAIPTLRVRTAMMATVEYVRREVWSGDG